MDFSILAPTLARFGAPLVAELLETAAGATGGPLAGLAVKGVADFVLGRLGATFGTAPDPAALAPAIEAAATADPAGTATKLQSVQDDHADLIQKAMAQAQIDEQNLENARSTSLEFAKVGGFVPSLISAAPAILGLFNLAMFAWVVWFFFSGHNVDSPNGNLIVGTIIGAYAATQTYFGGSTAMAKIRGDQAIALAHKAVPPGAVVVRPKGR